MIIVENLSKSFGGRILFEKVCVQFNAGNRYGLTGPNGAGKSTFLKILQGDEEASSGTFNIPRRVGILRQDQFKYDENRIIDTVLMGNRFLWAALEERDKLYIEPNLTNEMGMRLAELEVTIGEENGYTAEYQAAKLLAGIGIPESKHYDLMKTLPNDLKFRVLLAQALFGDPDALLLDEPTNYLDLQSIGWLEQSLHQYKGTLLVISHDRHFLNSVCTHIADIDYETIIVYTGNYDEMVTAKVQARQLVEAENRDKEKKVNQLREFVNKFSAGTRSTQAQSKLKEIERLEATELKKSNIQRPYIRFETKRPSGKEVIKVKNICKTYIQADGTPLEVIKGFSMEVRRGEKIGVIGNNGLGKTTLLKMLAGEIAPDSGSIELGYEASIGYFPQDYKQSLQDPNLNAFDWLKQFADSETTSEILRNYLGRMLFSGDEALKNITSLSGGESARLLMAKLMLLSNNVLILDEPTNHLDLEAVSALSQALSSYAGTAIFVSHDRDLISKAANRIIAFTKDKIEDYAGPYEEYLFSQQKASSEQPKVNNKQSKNKSKKQTQSVYDNF